MRIFERVGAQNDLAKAMLTRAALRQRAEDFAAARELLKQARDIFDNTGTRAERAVDAALAEGIVRLGAERNVTYYHRGTPQDVFDCETIVD